MKKLVLLLVASLMLAQLLVASPAQAATPFAAPQQAASFTSNETLPIDLLVYVPCALGGLGEDVYLSGNLHDLYHITFDANGGFHTDYSDNPQGVSGVGLTSGVKYQATGITRDTFGGVVGYAATYVNNFRIIGQGAGNNFLVHETSHVTVNANGEVTAYVDNFSVECR